MNNNLISEVKKKKEFSGLPDSIVARALEKNKNDVKEARAFLRKYFGVFLLNKVLKAKDESALNSHISSKKRDYERLYSTLKECTGRGLKGVIDFGCGINGFSYSFLLEKFGAVDYIGVEASKQICDLTNEFFVARGYLKAQVINEDLFNLDRVGEIISKVNSPKCIFLLQIIDALESAERNFSKNFLEKIGNKINEEDFIFISYSLKSLSGKRRFYSTREWFKKFLSIKFKILQEFSLFDEHFLILKIKK